MELYPVPGVQLNGVPAAFSVVYTRLLAPPRLTLTNAQYGNAACRAGIQDHFHAPGAIVEGRPVTNCREESKLSSL